MHGHEFRARIEHAQPCIHRILPMLPSGDNGSKLCLAGEHDRNAPARMMERMAGKIPGARYACLPGVGHLANLEAPQEFDRAILGFLREALPRAHSASLS